MLVLDPTVISGALLMAWIATVTVAEPVAAELIASELASVTTMVMVRVSAVPLLVGLAVVFSKVIERRAA